VLPGDSNFDGQFDSQDMIIVFQAGQYEDGLTHNSTWVAGDWNGDGDFTTRDFIYAFQYGASANHAWEQIIARHRASAAFLPPATIAIDRAAADRLFLRDEPFPDGHSLDDSVLRELIDEWSETADLGL
jgi:hypothetical protein